MVYDDPTKFKAGSGKKVMFKCSYPGCSAQAELQVKDRVKTYERLGHQWLHSCKHDGYIEYSEERRALISENSTKRHREARESTLKALITPHIWNQMDPGIQVMLIASSHNGTDCPKCGERQGVGMTLERRALEVKERGNYLCFHCLNTGIDILPPLK